MHRYTLPLALTTLCVFGYVFMEWLFFATKPSFLTPLSVLESVAILLATNAIVIGLALPTSCVFVTLGIGLSRMSSAAPAVASGRTLTVLVPSLALVALAILLVDNFTYTLFGFNIGSATGPFRFIYTAAYAVVLVSIVKQLIKISILSSSDTLVRVIHRAAAVVLSGSVLVVCLKLSGPVTISRLPIALRDPRCRISSYSLPMA